MESEISFFELFHEYFGVNAHEFFNLIFSYIYAFLFEVYMTEFIEKKLEISFPKNSFGN